MVQLRKEITNLEAGLDEISGIDHDEAKKADAYCSKVLSAMNKLREIADKLETETDDEYWLLPKYREMLFVY